MERQDAAGVRAPHGELPYRTMTRDNGKESAGLRLLERRLGLTVYCGRPEAWRNWDEGLSVTYRDVNDLTREIRRGKAR